MKTFLWGLLAGALLLLIFMTKSKKGASAALSAIKAQKKAELKKTLDLYLDNYDPTQDIRLAGRLEALNVQLENLEEIDPEKLDASTLASTLAGYLHN